MRLTDRYAITVPMSVTHASASVECEVSDVFKCAYIVVDGIKLLFAFQRDVVLFPLMAAIKAEMYTVTTRMLSGRGL